MTGKQTTQQGKPLSNAIDPSKLMEVLRTKLKTRGINGIVGLSRNFRIMDDNHSLTLDKNEFSKAIDDFQLGFTKQEVTALFSFFDTNKNGLIEYDEFLRAVRGDMNLYR